MLMFMKNDEIDVHQFVWGRRIGNMKFDPIFLLEVKLTDSLTARLLF